MPAKGLHWHVAHRIAGLGSLGRERFVAVAEWNAKGGVLGKQLDFSLEDDACDPKQAATVTPKIVATPNLTVVLNGICSGAMLYAPAGPAPSTHSCNAVATSCS